MRDALGCAKLSKVKERLENAKRMVVQSSPWLCRFAGSPIFFKSRFQISGRLARQGWAFS